MTLLRARVAVLLVFVAGFVSGAATLQLVRLNFERKVFRSKEPVPQLIVYQLDRELSLTDEQKRVVRDTILGARGEILKLRTDLLPQLTTIFDQGSARIRASLTPAQQEKFDRIVAERKRLMLEIQGRRQGER